MAEMTPVLALAYAAASFCVGILGAIALMLIFADLFEFNEQLDALVERIVRAWKEWRRR